MEQNHHHEDAPGNRDPGAWQKIPCKEVDAVMEAQKDLVEVVHTLEQVVCVKG